MSVTLTNTSGRCQVFVLAHDTYCRALGECVCDVQPGRSRKRLARSLTLATGVTSEEQPDAVLAVPDVAAAVRRWELSVRRHQAPTAPMPAQVSEPPSRSGKRKRGTE